MDLIPVSLGTIGRQSLLLWLCTAVWAANVPIKVVGSTETQIIISYTAPSSAACTVSAVDNNGGPAVNDLDPAKFARANSDLDRTAANGFRWPTLVDERKRTVFIGGHDEVKLGLDGNWYSTALQVNSDHTITVDCPDPDFTIVLVPDVHINEGAQYATSIGNWITANCGTWNCKAVIGDGDFDGTNTNNTTKQANIQSGYTLIYSKVDALGLPRISATGNHDYDNDSVSGRRSTMFDASGVGYAGINDKPYYGGYWSAQPNGDKNNQWIKFDAGSHKFGVIAAEFFPRSAALNWAKGIIAANPDRQFIYVSHSIENCTTWVAAGDSFGGNAYNVGSDSQGAAQRDAISAYDNALLAFNGHYIGCGTGGQHLEITWTGGSNSHPVYFMRSNYQETEPSWLTLLKFRPSQGEIEVYNLHTTDGSYSTSSPMYKLAWAH